MTQEKREKRKLVQERREQNKMAQQKIDQEQLSGQKSGQGSLVREKEEPELLPADRQAITEAMELLGKDLCEPPSVKELARKVGTNQQKLMSGFKQVTGYTVYGYLKFLRMTKAAELLRQTDLTVTRIAQEVGYLGDGNFQRAFMDFHNTTPGKFRKAKQGAD